MPSLKHLPPLLMISAAVSLFSLFFVPVWEISIATPFGTDDIRLYLWLDHITADTPEILDRFDRLNERAGVKALVRQLEWEFTYFPYSMLTLTVTCFSVIALNRWEWYAAWSVAWLAVGAFGFYDFYVWVRYYGYELSPELLKILLEKQYGLPLIGERRLAVFVAQSVPRVGSFLFVGGGLMGFVAAYVRWRQG